MRIGLAPKRNWEISCMLQLLERGGHGKSILITGIDRKVCEERETPALEARRRMAKMPQDTSVRRPTARAPTVSCQRSWPCAKDKTARPSAIALGGCPGLSWSELGFDSKNS